MAWLRLFLILCYGLVLKSRLSYAQLIPQVTRPFDPYLCNALKRPPPPPPPPSTPPPPPTTARPSTPPPPPTPPPEGPGPETEEPEEPQAPCIDGQRENEFGWDEPCDDMKKRYVECEETNAWPFEYGKETPSCLNRCLDNHQHSVQVGDPCDPMLYELFNKAWTDSDLGLNGNDGKTDVREEKVIDHFLVRPFNKSIESKWGKYKGPCKFFCPEVMCISYGHFKGWAQDETEFNKVKLVLYERFAYDIYKHDCKGTKGFGVPSYTGVCTCGHLWSRVDPVDPFPFFPENDQKRIKYKAVVGLNRKLIWDKENQRCAADQYGHCSLDWKENLEHRTFCAHPTHKCMDYSVLYKGFNHEPLSIRDKQGNELYAYGICAEGDLKPDLHASSSRIRNSLISISFSGICIALKYFIK